MPVDRQPILFVPGAWHGAWCWEEHFVPWFTQRGYEVKAIDFRRHDRRHAPGLRTTRISDYVEDVAAAAATMSSPPVLVGHSMGGFVVQKYLEDHPAPAAVLMASAPPTGILAVALRTIARHPLRMLLVNLTWSLYGVVSTPELARELLFSEGVSDEDVMRYQSKMTDEAFLAYMDMVLFVRPDVEKVSRTPLLVMGGGADRNFSVAEVEATARAYGVESCIFPGQAHDLMLEPAWEEMAERIDTFVHAHTRSTMAAPTA